MARRRKTDQTPTFEKLGAFYLGKTYDIEEGAIEDDLLLYDAKDLTTHAVCVGMTGSGKTGLCVALLEEAGIDGIPAIAIDPKGDLGNLMLTFPKMQPSDFRPWVDESAAARKGLTTDEYAKTTAEMWRNGLKQWGQDGKRIERFRSAVDVSIYTPGSTAGLPLSLLRSFAAPPPALVDDADALRERITGAVSGLLALIGIDADPINSREHILLSTLLQHAWREGRDLDIAALIREVQSPPFQQIGVLGLDMFFPEKERFALSMSLNNLLASPGFAAWMEGEPLDIRRLLWLPDGRPRISIMSIAHLSDAERMFFVTLLLNEMIAWMRTQPGTSSLRALLYMDEVFGYFPPTKNPPSKTPMLTLLKQARAFGLGVVLATQNPVDLDYKGLSNAGTWLLGRLQTERDKKRVLEALEGASMTAGTTFDRGRMDRTLAGLKSRVFVMNNVHDDEPVLFHTRWVLSYLRGPLVRAQIQQLMESKKKPAPKPRERKRAKHKVHKVSVGAGRPMLPPDITESFLAVTQSASDGSRLVYRAALRGTADIHFADSRMGIDEWETATYITPLGGKSGARVWMDAQYLSAGDIDLLDEPEEDVGFASLPGDAAVAESFTLWEKTFKTHLYRDRKIILYKHAKTKLTSELSDTEGEFRTRVRHALQEKRDVAVEKLRNKYAPRLARLQERIGRAEQRVEKETSQYRQQKVQTAISVGATVLGALFGRKLASVGNVGRASTAARGVGRAAREKEDIARAEQSVEALREEVAELEAEFQDAIKGMDAPASVEDIQLKERVIRLRKTDTAVDKVALVWTPWLVTDDGHAEPAYENIEC